MTGGKKRGVETGGDALSKASAENKLQVDIGAEVGMRSLT